MSKVDSAPTPSQATGDLPPYGSLFLLQALFQALCNAPNWLLLAIGWQPELSMAVCA